MPASGFWQIAAGKQRELIYFFYRDEFRAFEVEGVEWLSLGPYRLDRGGDTFGRFAGLIVTGADATTVVRELQIDGAPVWSELKYPGEGEVLDAPRPIGVHGRSVVAMRLSGAFERVLLVVERAQRIEPVKSTKEGAA